MTKAKLIGENESVEESEYKVIGEDHGFTGTLYRVKNVKLMIEGELEVRDWGKSFVVKTCNATWNDDVNSEAKFLLRVGPLF